MNRTEDIPQPGALARTDHPSASAPLVTVPGTAAAWGACAAVALVWGVVRLIGFYDQFFPLTYVLPLLICLWTRRRSMVWTLGALFIAMAAAEFFWIMPESARHPPQHLLAFFAAVVNILIGSAVIHLMVALRARLERALSDLAATNLELNETNEELQSQSEELAAQNEILAAQSDELTRQAEEAHQQSEELAQQNEELQSQAEEIEQLNVALTRREALLQRLLDATRLALGEQAALQDICAAAAGMFDDPPVAVVVYERLGDGLSPRAASGIAPGSPVPGELPVDRSLAGLALTQDHTAALTDTALRPDLALFGTGDHPFVSALAAPLHMPGLPGGALTVLCRERRDWTEIQFRLAEWLAVQCGRILETLRTQNELRRQAALLDLTPDAIIVRDLDGVITRWGRGAEAMYGWTAEEAVGRRTHELLRTRHPAPLADITAQIRNAGEWSGEIVHTARNGREVVVQSRQLLRPDVPGGPEVLESNVDVTARKEAELGLLAAKAGLENMVRERTAELARSVAELERANAELDQRAAQLRALAGDLAVTEQRERKRLSQILHDGLQQHLVAAKLQLGGLAGAGDDGEAAHIASQVEQLLNESIQISRSLSAELSPPILQDGGLADALGWLQRWMREKHDFGVEVTVENAVEPPPEIKTLVFESVRELLFNCVKHAAAARAVVRLSGVDGGLEVHVSDEGCGFDPARSGSAGNGGGFGLLSIRERIKLAGGDLKIDSAPGSGTRVLLKVPQIQPGAAVPAHTADRAESAPADAPQTPAAPAPSERIRILLADDHALVRDGIARLIGKEPDMEVVGAARDGREAIELARRLAPDVILMDIGMPEVSGIEATQVIHRERPGVRIIGLSMHEHHEHAQVMREAGAVDYRTKDCAPAELLAAVRACAGRRTAHPSPAASPEFRASEPSA